MAWKKLHIRSDDIFYNLARTGSWEETWRLVKTSVLRQPDSLVDSPSTSAMAPSKSCSHCGEV